MICCWWKRSRANHTLGVVSESHIFAKRKNCASVQYMLDIHACGMNLVVEGKALLFTDSALCELEYASCAPHENHLPVKLVEEDYAFEVLEAIC